MHEAVTTYFVEKRGMSRKHATRTVTLIAIILATVASLSMGAWSHIKVAGMNIFSLMDNFTAIVMLPILGIMTAIFVGWIWRKEDMKAELTAEGGVDKTTYPVIRFLLKWVCPVLVSVVFIFGIVDFVKSLNSEPEVEQVADETEAPAEEDFTLNVNGVDTLDYEAEMPIDGQTPTVVVTE
jgi:SNF family Na+-dependent transporter